MEKALLAEMRSYVGFTEADVALLARLQPFARPHFGAIADEFYAVIRMHKGAFRAPQDEKQARRLHASLQLWLGELLSGPPELYAEHCAHVGQVHVRVGLEPRHMVAAMGRIRAALQRVAADAFAQDRETSDAARLAVARVCDIDLAIAFEIYKNDLVHRIERAGARETAPVDPPVDGSRPLMGEALEAADVVLLAFDPTARVVIANRKAEQLTGYAFDELAGHNTFILLFGGRADAVRARWFEAANGIPIEMEEDLRTRSGKTRTVRWHATAQQPVANGSLSIVVVGVDVTNERELERQARRNERLAATGALAAGLAHEIRNPLNGANLHVAVLDRALARSRDVPREAREAIDVLRAEIKRLGALVTDFLEVARPGSLTRVDHDANEIARTVGALLGPEAEARKKVLAIETSPFPAAAKLDVERVKQVIVNLVRNGLEAVEEGGRVVIRVRLLPDHVEIDVTDDGCGVSDATAPIFDAFYSTKERGTGLGLSIVHRVVTDHGGDVRFESSPGSTVFTVRIPTEPLTGGIETTEA